MALLYTRPSFLILKIDFPFARTSSFEKLKLQNITYASLFKRMAYIFSGRCSSQSRLDGKTAIITGSNSGIGKANALDFCKRGCRVILACRDLQKTKEAIDDIEERLKDAAGKGVLIMKHLDLSSLRSVHSCASNILAEEERIDILINNAGVMMCPESETKDGFELQFGTNHLGHFLLTLLLLPRMIKSSPARIINVSSIGHKYGDNDFEDFNWKKVPYHPMKAYGRSKLANIHFTTELAKRLKGTGVTVYSVHPGYVTTNLGQHLDSVYFSGFRSVLRFFFGWLMKTPELGAETQIHCAISEEAGKETGLYYADCRPVEPFPVAKHEEAASKLWDLSICLVGYKGNPFLPH